MPPITRLIGAAVLTLLAASSAAAAAQLAGRIRGLVTDESGGVMPGVLVVASSEAGAVLATDATDATGSYVLSSVPAGATRLSFQIEGFATATIALTVRPGAESLVVQRLSLAPVTATVIVQGAAQYQRPLPPPPPVLKPVPPHDPASVCGPAKPTAMQVSFGTIRARRHEPDPGPSSNNADRGLYAKGDQLLIDGGASKGVRVGENFVARRYYRVDGPVGAATGEHSSGLLQIVAADEQTSTAVVVYACDEIMSGDFLGAFRPEPLRAADPAGTPAYHDAARILFGDAGQMLGVPRRMLVIDRGTDHGLQAGQRLTIFRREARGGNTPSVLGDGVVVAVRADSATIRVETATDAILFGDWAAPQRSALEVRRQK